MARPQSCAETTILLLILLSGTVFGSLFLIADEDTSSRPSEAIPVTEISFESPNCAWTWGYGTDTDGAGRLSDALEAAGFEGSTVSVSTFGEWCNPMNPNFEDYFAVMDSSPQITLPLDNASLLQDDVALGDLVVQILSLIDNAELRTPREIIIVFEAEGESREWRAMSSDVDRSLSGAEMFAQGTDDQ